MEELPREIREDVEGNVLGRTGGVGFINLVADALAKPAMSEANREKGQD